MSIIRSPITAPKFKVCSVDLFQTCIYNHLYLEAWPERQMHSQQHVSSYFKCCSDVHIALVSVSLFFFYIYIFLHDHVWNNPQNVVLRISSLLPWLEQMLVPFRHFHAKKRTPYSYFKLTIHQRKHSKQYCITFLSIKLNYKQRTFQFPNRTVLPEERG